MDRQLQTQVEPLLLGTLVKELDTKGSLHVLRHGFKVYGTAFHLGYFKPAHQANPDVLKLFAQNRLTVTRQVPCHPGDNRTLDIVPSVNGLPVATIELKSRHGAELAARRAAIQAGP